MLASLLSELRRFCLDSVSLLFCSPGCVPCSTVMFSMCLTIQFETLGCVPCSLFAWLRALLYCHLKIFGCVHVPYSFAEMLLLSASIAKDVMFGLLLCLPGCVPCSSLVWLCALLHCSSYVWLCALQFYLGCLAVCLAVLFAWLYALLYCFV